MKWIKNNKLVLLLALLGFLIVGFPLFVLGIEKTVFWSIDPDVVYVTNALLYTKYHLISYIDHPGTPSIMLFYYAMFPLRLSSKYYLHQNFIQWAFDNYYFLTYYLRIFQLIVFSFSLLLFLNLIKKITKTNLGVFIAFLSIVLFGGIDTYIYINPETLSIFLVTVWLILFTKFNSTKKYIFIILCSALAGFALANKFTNLILIIASLLLPLAYQNKTAMKLKILGISILASFASFVIGIWPIRGSYRSIINWVFALFTHTKKYGMGTVAVFDYKSYFSSIMSLTQANPLLIVFFIASFLLLMYLVLRKKITISNPFCLLSLLSFLITLIYAKYATVHYFNANIFILIFCDTILLTKVKLVRSKIIAAVLLIIFLVSFRGYLIPPSNPAPDRKDLNKVLEGWTATWSADVFREQLNISNTP